METYLNTIRLLACKSWRSRCVFGEIKKGDRCRRRLF